MSVTNQRVIALCIKKQTFEKADTVNVVAVGFLVG